MDLQTFLDDNLDYPDTISTIISGEII